MRFLAQNDLRFRRFQQFPGFQAKLQIQLTIVEPVSGRFLECVMELHTLLGWGSNRQFREKSLVGDAEPILVVAHAQSATNGEVEFFVLEVFHEAGELRLALGVGPGDDQTQLVVENAQIALAIERELIFDGRVDQPGKTNHPGAGLANSRRFLQRMSIALLFRRDRRRLAFMIIEGILGNAAQRMIA